MGTKSGHAVRRLSQFMQESPAHLCSHGTALRKQTLYGAQARLVCSLVHLRGHGQHSMSAHLSRWERQLLGSSLSQRPELLSGPRIVVFSHQVKAAGVKLAVPWRRADAQPWWQWERLPSGALLTARKSPTCSSDQPSPTQTLISVQKSVSNQGNSSCLPQITQHALFSENGYHCFLSYRFLCPVIAGSYGGRKRNDGGFWEAI